MPWSGQRSERNLMRLLIADNQAKVRYALRVLFEKEPDIDVAGEASSTESLQKQISACSPDVLIVDWLLLDNHSFERLQDLRAIAPNMKIIILSSKPEQRETILHAGADAFISKIDPPDRLLAAISEAQEQM